MPRDTIDKNKQNQRYIWFQGLYVYHNDIFAKNKVIISLYLYVKMLL